MTVTRRRPPRLLLLVLAGTALLVGALAGCSSDAGDTVSRRAQAELASDGWDVEMHLILTNETLHPVEVGAFADSQDGGYYISTTPGSARNTLTRSIVIPAATKGGTVAGTVDVFLQGKATDEYKRVSKLLVYAPTDPYEGQHFWISTPTMQFRITTVYTWRREPNCGTNTVCHFERRAQVQVKTLDQNGDARPANQILSCLDPISLPGWEKDVGSLDDTSSARWAAKRILADTNDGPYQDGFHVTFRRAADIDAKACASNHYNPGYVLPAASLAMVKGADDEPGTGIQLPDLTLRSSTMPGTDFSWANLDGADFGSDTHSNLSYASFDHANLTDADLSHANLTGATFDGALVDGVNLKGATLYGVDLSTTTGKLGDLAGVLLCKTKLPQYLVDELGPDYQPYAGCNLTWWNSVGAQPGYDGVLVDTGSRVPLILLSNGGPSCRAQSAAGSHQGIRLPPCSVSYGSALLPGGVGTFIDGNGGMRGPYGTLDLRLDPPLFGWDDATCLKAMSTPDEQCPDHYRVPPATATGATTTTTTP